MECVPFGGNDWLVSILFSVGQCCDSDGMSGEGSTSLLIRKTSFSCKQTSRLAVWDLFQTAIFTVGDWSWITLEFVTGIWYTRFVLLTVKNQPHTSLKPLVPDQNLESIIKCTKTPSRCAIPENILINEEATDYRVKSGGINQSGIIVTPYLKKTFQQ